MRKKFFTVTISLVSIVLIGVLYFLSLNKNSNIFKDNKNVDTEKYFLGYPIYNVLLEKGSDYYVQFQNVYHQDDNVSDMYVSFDDFHVTKKRGNYKFDFREWHKEPNDKRNIYEIDSNGNILNGWSYLVMEVTVVNYDDYPIKVGMNSFSCQLGKEYGACTKNSPDFYNSKKGVDSQEYGIIELDPKVKYTFTFACVVEDKCIEPYVSNGEYYLNVEFNMTEEKNLPIVKRNEDR